MKLSNDTTYEQWDELRRKRFQVQDGMDDVVVKHTRYETSLFYCGNGTSSVATWSTSTGSCYIKTRREAIFSVLQLTRNYMMNSFNAWAFKDGRNVDNDLPWGTLLANVEVDPDFTKEEYELELSAAGFYRCNLPGHVQTKQCDGSIAHYCEAAAFDRFETRREVLADLKASRHWEDCEIKRNKATEEM